MYPCPSSGPTLPSCESATPPSPATPEPSPNVQASMRAVGMPQHAAMPRFCVTARTWRPSARPLQQEPDERPTTSDDEDHHGHAAVRQHEPVHQLDAAREPVGFATVTFCAPKIRRTVWIRIKLMPQVASSVSSGRP